MPKTNIYIDGFNLYYGALKSKPKLKWLNLCKLSQQFLPRDEIGKIYFFTANLKEKFPGDAAPQRQNTYLRALESSGIVIILGYFQKYIGPLAIARQFGAVTGLGFINNGLVASRLLQAVDFTREVRSETLADCQFANTVFAKNERELLRPREWK